MTDTSFEHGPCPRCEGCGDLADNEFKTPWRAWQDLPIITSPTMRESDVEKVECSQCSGTGLIRHKRWLISWVGERGSFDLRFPWYGDKSGLAYTFYAAVLAASPKEARAVIVAAHDKRGMKVVCFRYIWTRSDDWSPYADSDRFNRTKRTQWPAEGGR